jgi:integrase
VSRRAPGEGTVFRSADGRWEAMVDLGPDPATGRRRRLHLRGATKVEVTAKMRRAQEQGQPGDRQSVSNWLETWLDVVARTFKPSTLRTYRTHVKYALGAFGAVRLANLGPEHLERCYDNLMRRGVSAISVQSVHRTLRPAFGEAARRGLLSANPVRLARPPRAQTVEVVPLSLGEARAVLAAASRDRNGARWLLAIGLGLRQGEALGLCWEDIDLDTGTLSVRRALCRAQWRHGCAPARRCGADRPAGCSTRMGGGLVTVEPKSARSRRSVHLPEPLLDALRAHKRAQAAERLAAGELWEHGPHGG